MHSSLVFIFVAGLVAGFIDAIAGGSGLIMVPALIFAGLDPRAAIATNKLCNAGGALTGTVRFAARGLVDWKTVRWSVAPSVLASLVGSLLITRLSRAVLEPTIVVLLVLVTLVTVLKPAFGTMTADLACPPGPRARALQVVLSTAVGFHDGIFGPGAGILLTFSLIACSKMNFLRATATSKTINLATTLGALALFLVAGAVSLRVGVIATAGITLGAYAGSGVATHRGPRIIKPVFVVVTLAMVGKLLLV